MTELKITGIDENMNGLAESDGTVYRVFGALPGERVTAAEERRRGREIYCTAGKVLDASSDRAEPPCPYYSVCGNCSLMHAAYDRQLAFKTAAVARALPQFEGKVNPCRGLYYPYKYRNKLQLAFQRSSGKLRIGFYRAGSKEVVDVEKCPLHDAWFGKAVAAAREFAEKFKLEPYDPDTGLGNLRYMTFRRIGNALCAVVVAAEQKPFGMRWLSERISRDFPNYALYSNLNDSERSNVYGPAFTLEGGDEDLHADFLGVRVPVKPKIFLQTNEKMTSYILKDLVAMILASGAKSVLDVYSGAGISSLLFAKNGLRVVAIEREKSASFEAKRLARLNGFPQIECLCGDASELLPEALSGGADAVFVDPPRAGLESAVAPLLAAKPERIYYLSCYPPSLAKDLEALGGAYELTFAQPYDMFPQTGHVETLATLVRKHGKRG